MPKYEQQNKRQFSAVSLTLCLQRCSALCSGENNWFTKCWVDTEFFMWNKQKLFSAAGLSG